MQSPYPEIPSLRHHTNSASGWFVLGVMLLLLSSEPGSAARPIFDLVGKWDGSLEFGKFKIRITLRMVKTESSRLLVTAEIPEQGTKGIPVNAVLFNDPDVRIEIDAFNTAFSGKLNDTGLEIEGAFDEGPAGRPEPTKFIKSTAPEKPEPKKIYNWTGKVPPDPRGYWKSEIEIFPGMKARLGLKVAAVEDGTFAMDLDNLDFGMTDAPAVGVVSTARKISGEWKIFQAKLEAEMSEDGKTLNGTWAQGGRNSKIAFERIDKPATALPSDLDFTPSTKEKSDPVGHWLGSLEVGGQKLRLRLKIGRDAKGENAGSLNSIDQSPQEIPLTNIEKQESEQVFELRMLQAKFTGKYSQDGQTLEGTWQQATVKFPLSLKRISEKEAEALR